MNTNKTEDFTRLSNEDLDVRIADLSATFTQTQAYVAELTDEASDTSVGGPLLRATRAELRRVKVEMMQVQASIAKAKAERVRRLSNGTSGTAYAKIRDLCRAAEAICDDDNDRTWAALEDAVAALRAVRGDLFWTGDK
jgi:hypothetical protein